VEEANKMPDPQPGDPTATTEKATLNSATGNRSNLFTVDKADTLVYRTSGPPVARTESYPALHSEVLKSLIGIVKKYPKDGNDRVPALLELAESIPLSHRPTLYSRLSRPGSNDAFALYFRNNFTTTRELFLRALSGSPTTEHHTESAETRIQPPQSTGLKDKDEFVSHNYIDVKSDSMYIDNFTNDIMDAWLPNDHSFYFEYPGEIALLISLQSLLKGIDIYPTVSKLRDVQEKQIAKILKNVPDFEFPRSTAAEPGSPSVIRTFDRSPKSVVFYRNIKTRIIYPVDSSAGMPSPISKNYLPRISSALQQIEAVRFNEESMQGAMLQFAQIFEAYLPPLEMILGSLAVRFVGLSAFRAFRAWRATRAARLGSPKLPSGPKSKPGSARVTSASEAEQAPGPKPKSLGAAAHEGREFTTSSKQAMERLGLTKEQFNKGIHDIKKHIQGNPDMKFDLKSGDVFDQRSDEWVGNLLDYID
jgi:hypothetical protein